MCIRDRLQEMVREYEGTVLFISHDKAFCDLVATRKLTIENGKILGQGDAPSKKKAKQMCIRDSFRYF